MKKYQLPLFSLSSPEESSDLHEESKNWQEWGTFKDSLRAPIHNWFTYPAGFSYKAVEASFSLHMIRAGQTIYDPFMGSGTTNLTAKKLGINSFGLEAHPFVFRIAKTKLNWDSERTSVLNALSTIRNTVDKARETFQGDLHSILESEFPELVLKCYEDKTLFDLLLIRNAIFTSDFPEEINDLLFVGVTGLLRQISTAATGWPYIAPKKRKNSSLNKVALPELSKQILRMVEDIEITKSQAHLDFANTHHKIFNSDSRNTIGKIPNDSIDHVFTSPPYLNNFDYADRTRLELYFWGEAKTWGDISRNIRTRLITSATTQISRDDPKYILSEQLKVSCPEVYSFLSKSVSQLGNLRLQKGGKKSYDHLVSGYFNDMYQVVADVFRVLKPQTTAVIVLGDSAPYGVHIPTDELIGIIGLGIGFSGYSIKVLRSRGGKWKDNPQRHNVVLKESVVTLTKN